MRDWGDDEAIRKVAREMRAESAVWAKLLVEHSAAAGRADPLGLLRYAFGDGIDEAWNGRMVDLVTFAAGGVHHSWRLSSQMLVGPSLRATMRMPAGGGKAGFATALRQCAGRAVGPDLIVVVTTPECAVPKQLPKGAKEATFMIGALGGEPSVEQQALAAQSGGTALALCDEADARFLGAMFCKAFLTLAQSGAGHVAEPAAAQQHYDADSIVGSYVTPSGYGVTRGYALGEYGAPHGLDRLGHREEREVARGYGGGYRSYVDPYEDVDF